MICLFRGRRAAVALATTQVMGQGSPVNGRFASFSALNRGLARIPRISKITFVMPYFAADQRSPWQQTTWMSFAAIPIAHTRATRA